MIHLITYGDDNYNNSKKRLEREALDTGWFDSVTVYGPEILDSDFKNKFKEVLSHSRGAGYWIWKIYIIQKKLSEINDNDILIYLDAGCSINAKGKERFYEYVDMLNTSDEGIISFKMSHQLEKWWTTKEIFNYFNVDLNSDIANSGQLVGGILIMKKTLNLKIKLDMVYKVYEDNCLLVTDYYSKDQAPYFKDNRHDQSIFSIIRKLHKSIELEDETYFWNQWDTRNQENYPFLALRLK
tara:strand:- start:625 stop:1344 length:720 start_codon:yes stop_codon:yes gene_type:complete